MKPEDLAKPAVPVVYGLLILDLAEKRGVGRETMLAGLNIPPALLETADARLSLVQAGQLLYRGMKLTGDPALGYEIGLNSNLTTHGFIGYGMMSNPTARQAVEFGAKFLQLRLPNLSLQLLTENDTAVVEVTETVSLGAVRQLMFDLFLVGIARITQQMRLGELKSGGDVELWFDYPEPEYFARYRERLPRARFSMSSNQLRFPAELLDRPLYAADPITAQLVTQQLENELTLMGYSGDFLGRVRAILVNRRGYPNLETVATRLRMSSRTLKRKLQQLGVSFQQLQDEARKRDSIRLLSDPTLTVEAVASRVGYTDPANFTRAFRKWTGSTPSMFRSNLAADSAQQAK
jgi:AraC-like DNA-binding protein